MKKLLFSLMVVAAAVALGNPYAGYDAAMKSAKDNPSAVEWSKANDAKLAARTSPAKLAAFVANERTAKALLAQLNGAYATDSLSACQIAAVSQWVMQPDPWYCLWWNGEHADGREVWVEALLVRAESAKDPYVKQFCLDQLRWCGYGCPEQIERIRAIGTSSGDTAVAGFADMVARGLEKAE